MPPAPAQALTEPEVRNRGERHNHLDEPGPRLTLVPCPTRFLIKAAESSFGYYSCPAHVCAGASVRGVAMRQLWQEGSCDRLRGRGRVKWALQ